MRKSASSGVQHAEDGAMSRDLLLLWLLFGCTGRSDGSGDTDDATVVDDTGAEDTSADDTASSSALDAYRDSMARTYCGTVWGCEGYGEEFFASIEECVATWEGLVTLDDCPSRCAFDAGTGATCIADLAAYSCAEVESGAGAPESCFSVFDCGAAEPGNCLEGLCPLGE